MLRPIYYPDLVIPVQEQGFAEGDVLRALALISKPVDVIALAVENLHRRPQSIERIYAPLAVDSDILEASYAPYIKAEVQPLPWMRVTGGLRTEMFTFNVQNRCSDCVEQPAGRATSTIVLPKANLILGPWFRTEFFANYGEGYHSNDARTAVTPGSSPLARARTYEVGVRSRPWGPIAS